MSLIEQEESQSQYRQRKKHKEQERPFHKARRKDRKCGVAKKMFVMVWEGD